MPRTPENGARIVLRSIVAWISPTLRLGLLLRRRGLVAVGLGGDALLAQARHAVEAAASSARAAPAAAASCACSCRVSSWTSTSPLRTVLPDSNSICSHDARQVRAHRHAVDGGDRADRGQGRRPVLLLRDDRRDRLRRRLEGRVLIAVLIWPYFTAPMAAMKTAPRQHQEHPLRHQLLRPTRAPRSRPRIALSLDRYPEGNVGRVSSGGVSPPRRLLRTGTGRIRRILILALTTNGRSGVRQNGGRRPPLASKLCGKATCGAAT